MKVTRHNLYVCIVFSANFKRNEVEEAETGASFCLERIGSDLAAAPAA